MKDLKTPKKDVFFLEVFSSDSPGTNGLKNQHFADFLYKSAVLEDVLTDEVFVVRSSR